MMQMFLQRHQPGLRGLSDFTELKCIGVTITGKLLAHKLYRFRLGWSHWSWMQIVLGSESFSALAESLQEAHGQLGGVRVEHKTDNLRLHGNNRMKTDGALCCSVPALRHAGCTQQYRAGRENASAESARGHLKRCIRQALIQRGSNDFSPLGE